MRRRLAVGTAALTLAVVSSCGDDAELASGVAITEPTIVSPTTDRTAEASASGAVTPTSASTAEQPSTTQAVATTTSMAEQSTTTSVPSVGYDVVRNRGDVVQRMVTEELNGYPSTRSAWQDPLDASAGWVDVERVVFDYAPGCTDDGQVVPDSGQPHWYIELAAKPSLATDLEPGILIAYGLVLETNGDGVADYLIGIDNDAPNQGDFHVWVTDLASGETDEQIGPPYGYPIEFRHPDEQQPDDPASMANTMLFTFLDSPPDLNAETVRFTAWTSATSGDEVLANDYAPDTGWITPTILEFSCAGPDASTGP